MLSKLKEKKSDSCRETVVCQYVCVWGGGGGGLLSRVAGQRRRDLLGCQDRRSCNSLEEYVTCRNESSHPLAGYTCSHVYVVLFSGGRSMDNVGMDMFFILCHICFRSTEEDSKMLLLHAHTHAHMCTHMHTCAHTCTHVHTHAHMCTHMHTCAHTCTRTHRDTLVHI